MSGRTSKNLFDRACNDYFEDTLLNMCVEISDHGSWMASHRLDGKGIMTAM